MMKVEELKHKVKIMFEYPKIKDYKLGSYLIVSKEDLNKLHLKVFLKDGEVVMDEDIKNITLCVKDTILAKNEGDKDGGKNGR